MPAIWCGHCVNGRTRYLFDLALAEFLGGLAGPLAYLRARRARQQQHRTFIAKKVSDHSQTENYLNKRCHPGTREGKTEAVP